MKSTMTLKSITLIALLGAALAPRFWPRWRWHGWRHGRWPRHAELRAGWRRRYAPRSGRRGMQFQQNNTQRTSDDTRKSALRSGIRCVPYRPSTSARRFRPIAPPWRRAPGKGRYLEEPAPERLRCHGSRAASSSNDSYLPFRCRRS